MSQPIFSDLSEHQPDHRDTTPSGGGHGQKKEKPLSPGKGHVCAESPLRALLVRSESGPWYKPNSESAVQELKGLSEALELNVIDTWVCRLRRSPHPGTFLGKGWVDRVRQFIASHEIQVVIMDPDLTAIQQRVLEKTWKCPVWDRTALILRIFQSRARTAAGRLQVSLASLLYQKSRLVRAWTHLERQRGGFGFLGGPGESQLELDRRILETKNMKIKKQLEQVRKTRSLHRKSRKNTPIVALVGYTNTGKSTLFRALTNSDVLCADMPFATLDPTTRSLYLPSGQSVLLTDTVGFISQLPAFLKLAFQATLEEITTAALIIHVRDQSSAHSQAQKAAVLEVLAELKCHQPIIEVWNKADLVSQAHRQEHPGLWISAIEKTGLDALVQAITLALDDVATDSSDSFADDALLDHDDSLPGGEFLDESLNESLDESLDEHKE